MASNINPDMANLGYPASAAVRKNFATAKTEIEGLQDAVGALQQGGGGSGSGPSLSSSLPLVNSGSGSAGTATTAARGDHVHPVDSTLAPKSSPALTGIPTAPTAAAGTNTTQIATTAFVNAAVPSTTGLAPLASPALTGTPTAPTASAGTNTTQLATTAFVTSATNTAVNGLATLANPSFTGNPTVPTQTAGDNSTKIASTAFVAAAVAAGGGGGGSTAFSAITGQPTDNTNLATALKGKVNASRVPVLSKLTKGLMRARSGLGSADITIVGTSKEAGAYAIANSAGNNEQFWAWPRQMSRILAAVGFKGASAGAWSSHGDTNAVFNANESRVVLNGGAVLAAYDNNNRILGGRAFMVNATGQNIVFNCDELVNSDDVYYTRTASTGSFTYAISQDGGTTWSAETTVTTTNAGGNAVGKLNIVVPDPTKLHSVRITWGSGTVSVLAFDARWTAGYVNIRNAAQVGVTSQAINHSALPWSPLSILSTLNSDGIIILPVVNDHLQRLDIETITKPAIRAIVDAAVTATDVNSVILAYPTPWRQTSYNSVAIDWATDQANQAPYLAAIAAVAAEKGVRLVTDLYNIYDGVDPSTIVGTTNVYGDPIHERAMGYAYDAGLAARLLFGGR